MEDRELLELAAKACGMTPPWDSNGCFVAWIGSPITGHWWNPFEDDGDALRLAFALEMSVDMYGCIIGYSEDSQYEFENTTGDLANVRRAIVEVAAYLARIAV